MPALLPRDDEWHFVSKFRGNATDQEWFGLAPPLGPMLTGAETLSLLALRTKTGHDGYLLHRNQVFCIHILTQLSLNLV